MPDWRKTNEAEELRSYIDKTLKPRKSGMKNLDREVIIDFVAKEVAKAFYAGEIKGSK